MDPFNQVIFFGQNYVVRNQQESRQTFKVKFLNLSSETIRLLWQPKQVLSIINTEF